MNAGQVILLFSYALIVGFAVSMLIRLRMAYQKDKQRMEQRMEQETNTCGGGGCEGCAPVNPPTTGYSPNWDIVVTPNLVVPRHNVLYWFRDSKNLAVAVMMVPERTEINTGMAFDELMRSFR